MFEPASTLQLLTGLGGMTLGGAISLATTWIIDRRREKSRDQLTLKNEYARWSAAIAETRSTVISYSRVKDTVLTLATANAQMGETQRQITDIPVKELMDKRDDAEKAWVRLESRRFQLIG